MTSRLLGGTALGLLVAGLVAYGGHQMVRVWQLRHEIEVLERDITALRAQTEKLTETVNRLQNDPAYIEKLAREELGYVREGDAVLKFPAQGR